MSLHISPLSAAAIVEVTGFDTWMSDFGKKFIIGSTHFSNFLSDLQLPL